MMNAKLLWTGVSAVGEIVTFVSGLKLDKIRDAERYEQIKKEVQEEFKRHAK